jgi:hypothetical protein
LAAFSDCDLIKKIEIPASVEIIDGCFAGCNNLREITFEPGSRLKYMGSGNFRATDIETLRLPSGARGNGALGCSDLRVFSFDLGVELPTEFWAAEFRSTKLEWIDVPSSIESIGNECFCRCHRLSEVNFERNSRLKTLGLQAFSSAGLKSITIPRSVERIGGECFRQCRFLREIKFEHGSELRKIGWGAFAGCPIQAIFIPSKVLEIGENCFEKCTELRSFMLGFGSDLREIGCQAFSGTVFEEIDSLAECVEIEMQRSEFHNRDPRSMKYRFLVIRNSVLMSPDGQRAVRCLGCDDLTIIAKEVKSIGEGCFENSRTLQGIFIGQDSQLHKIECRAFSCSALRRITVPKSVESIGEKCFWRCFSLCEVEFERRSRLRVIGSFAFADTSLRSLRIPRYVERIESYCFYQNESLTEVVFEEGCGLEELGFCAFAKIGLEEISVPMIPVSKTPSDPSESSSISRVIHWAWMRDHEEKPTVIIVSQKKVPDDIRVIECGCCLCHRTIRPP